ncbi:MAG: aminotransferase class V-fold PLP-dependent enzyme [Syntrophorhabdus sp.]
MNIRYWPIILADVFLSLISVFFAALLRFGPPKIERTYIEIIVPFMVAAIVLRPVILGVCGVYKKLWRYSTTRDFLGLIAGVLAGSAALFLLNRFVLAHIWEQSFTASAIMMEGFINLALVVLFRFFLKEAEHYAGDIDWKKTGILPRRNVLIVGAGSAGIHAFTEIDENPYLGLRVVAFIDDETSKIGRRTQGLPVFGPIIRLSEIVKKKEIDEVIIAIPSAPQQTIANIQAICQEISVPHRTLPYFGHLLEGGEESADVPTTTLKLPMSLPDITGDEIQAVVRVMQSRNLSIGSRTVEFEGLVAEFAHAKYGVAVTNGTSALHLCMIASGVGPGDEVITSPFSFIASANCILFERAVPVFVDIDPVTLNMDPAKLEAAITEKTKAIIVVHVFGQPADLDPIMQIADKYNLTVIEDACEAIGAEYKGRRVGAIGKAGTFAFYPNKQMTTGEGAALVTNDEEWANLFRSLRNQGRDKFDGWLNHSRLGYNYRMSELNAAVGVVQLKRLDEILKKRNEVAEKYARSLSSVPHVRPLQVTPETTSMSWFVYIVRFGNGILLDDVIKLMEKQGIPTRPYFSPIHLQPFYRSQFGFKPGDFPEAESAGKSIIALPFHTNMKSEEIEVVCSTLNKVIKEIGGAGNSVR